MASTPDPHALFAVLGVDETTPWEGVRRAFRAAIRASHPDLNAGDPLAEQRVRALNAAWEQVNTPRKWTQYIAQPTAAAASTRRGAPRGSPVAADPTVARVQVRRQRAGAAGLRRWKLELDGQVVATVENGRSSELEARPGAHSLRVFYDACSSPPLGVRLRAGEELVLGCRQRANPLLSLFAPRRSLVLELLSRRRFA